MKTLLNSVLICFLTLGALLGASQLLLPYREFTHPLFPYVTLEHPTLPYFNRKNFSNKLVSWYALDPYLGGALAELNQPLNEKTNGPFGALTPPEYARILLSYGSEIDLSALTPHVEKNQDSIVDPLTLDVHTSSQGFRVPAANPPPIAMPKPPDVFRVVTFGDSLTFGFGVDEQASWVAQLRKNLEQKAPKNTRVEVVNAGVISFDSTLGKRFFDSQIDSLNPDLVLIGYGFNDYSFNSRNFTDDSKKSKIFNVRLVRWIRNSMSEQFRKKRKSTPQTLSKSEKTLSGLRGKHATSPDDYAANIDAMAGTLKKRGIRFILLNTTIPSPLYVAGLKTLAKKYDVPLLDFNDILLRSQKGAAPATTEQIAITFELKPQSPTPQQRFFAVGDFFSTVEFGLSELNDEGQNGDRVKGDGIYSRQLSFLNGTLLSFRFALHDPTIDKDHYSEEFLGWRVFRRLDVNPKSPTTVSFAYNDLSDHSYRNFTLFPLMQEICHPNTKGHQVLGPAISKAVLSHLSWPHP